MNETRDIQSRIDLELIIQRFYEQLLVDETVGFLFTEVVKLDLEEHLAKLVDFWEDQLFGTRNYSGNPMRVHMNLNSKSALKKEHFGR